MLGDVRNGGKHGLSGFFLSQAPQRNKNKGNDFVQILWFEFCTNQLPLKQALHTALAGPEQC